ncbi:PaaI family thioesterase [Ruegeria sp. HKCCD8929]|uniref:PaaI family thioesterase n=1 Tax=Ruegeria sp. HKCCD8929 TaxID=2683006 RepID=UPI001488A1BC|nr:PaaI family thioesterase [Ruegeria sp. HKCCD8929]
MHSAQHEGGRPNVRRSGCQNAVGFEIDLSDPEGHARCHLQIGPQHLNSQQVLHGGIIAMLLDVACGNAASAWFDRAEHPMVLTVSLNTSYVAAVCEGVVTATGRPAGGGRKLVHVNGELRQDDGTLVATATGVFKRRALAP